MHFVQQQTTEFVRILLFVMIQPECIRKFNGIHGPVGSCSHADKQGLEQGEDRAHSIIISRVVVVLFFPRKDPLDEHKILRETLELCIEIARGAQIFHAGWCCQRQQHVVG